MVTNATDDATTELLDASPLAGELYTDAALFRRELDELFAGSWVCAGREETVPREGDFLVREIGDESIVVSRAEDGALHAFFNVCRHRGARLVAEPRGEGRRHFVCPYHAWTYGLDGRLITAPRGNREGGIVKEELGLVPLRLDTWGPLLFVSPDADAEPLEDYLDGVPELIANAGIDLEALRFLQRSESELDCNWKIAAENYLECYHCPTAHPGFSAVMNVSPDAYLLETSATRMTQHGPPRAEPRGAYDPIGEVERGQFHLLFPGTIVNAMPGKPNFAIGPIMPRGIDRTYRFLDYFVSPDADEAWIDESLAFDAQVGAEDRTLIERVQAGMRSGLIDEGRLLPESEKLIAHFQSLVVDALA